MKYVCIFTNMKPHIGIGFVKDFDVDVLTPLAIWIDWSVCLLGTTIFDGVFEACFYLYLYF